MRPVLENSFIDALSLMQMFAPIGRNAGVEDVMVTALDDVDGVNLDITQVRHRGRRGLRTGAERFGSVQALGMQPDTPGLDGVEVNERIRQSGFLPTERTACAREHS